MSMLGEGFGCLACGWALHGREQRNRNWVVIGLFGFLGCFFAPGGILVADRYFEINYQNN